MQNLFSEKIRKLSSICCLLNYPREYLPLNCQSQQLLSALLSVILKVIFANKVDPDQTAPLGAVWSGSTLFACMQK